MNGGLPLHTRVLPFADPTDMPQGRDGLFVLVRAAGEAPLSGDLFVFISRRRDRAKIMTLGRGSLVLWYKPLERGRFRHPRRGARDVELDATGLAMLLDGIDVERVHRRKRWRPKTTCCEPRRTWRGARHEAAPGWTNA